MSKPREFWIWDDQIPGTLWVQEDAKVDSGDMPYIHVIEKSAYDELFDVFKKTTENQTAFTTESIKILGARIKELEDTLNELGELND